MRQSFLAFVLLLQGCYFFYPSNIPAKGKPVVVPGAKLDLEVDEYTWWGSCSDYDLQHDKCEFHEGKLRTRHLARDLVPTYDGKRITVGEFNMLSRPGYAEQVERIRARHGACKLSFVPSAVAAVGVLVATAGLALSNSLGEDTALKLYIAGGAAFAGGAALSYPLGGYACWKAHGEGKEINIDASANDRFRGLNEDEIAKVAELAMAFNAKAGATPPTAAPAETSDAPPAETPKLPAGGGDIVQTLEANGCCSIFLRAVASAGMTDQLRAAGPLVVFAINDGAFSGIERDKLDKIMTQHDQLRRDLAFHISNDEFSPKSLAGGQQSLTMLNGKKVKIAGSPTEMTVKGHAVLGTLRAANGAVYIVDKALAN